MIAKSEFSEMISDMVLILEKQVSELSRNEIVEFLEAVNTSDDKTLPLIVLGKSKQMLFKDIESNEVKVIDSVTIREVLDYEEFKKSGNIALRKAS